MTYLEDLQPTYIGVITHLHPFTKYHGHSSTHTRNRVTLFSHASIIGIFESQVTHCLPGVQNRRQWPGWQMTSDYLAGGWTNPSEKYARQIGSFAQVEVNIQKCLNPPLRLLILNVLNKTFRTKTWVQSTLKRKNEKVGRITTFGILLHGDFCTIPPSTGERIPELINKNVWQPKTEVWLVVSTHLKSTSQKFETFPKQGWK